MKSWSLFWRQFYSKPYALRCFCCLISQEQAFLKVNTSCYSSNEKNHCETELAKQ